ncbi:MAG: methyl-accepting chemotaxis protein [Spirochaetales bacterium]|nr:methyl-accepting chemotaxis protein [Spirochaetales bacterium]
MKKGFSLTLKISLGFAALIVIATILGFMGWFSTATIENRVLNADDTNRIIKEVQNGRVAQLKFMSSGDKSYIDEIDTYNKTIETTQNNLLQRLQVQSDRDLVNNFSTAYETWYEDLLKYAKNLDDMDQGAKNMADKGAYLVTTIEELAMDQKNYLENELRQNTSVSALIDRVDKFNDSNDLVEEILQTKSLRLEYMSSHDSQKLNELKALANTIHNDINSLLSRFVVQADINRANTALTALADYNQSLEEYVEHVTDSNNIYSEIVTSAETAIQAAEGLRETQKQKMEDFIIFANVLMITLALGGMIIGVLLAVFITRSIVGPLTKATDTIRSSSGQIALASNQLSSSSQEIANGATEQASSIEETTSSMEELASMVKQNAGNAKEASTLSDKARDASQIGFDQMKKMVESMSEINKSSGEIRKIIDVIDNIAFQTNILALNAAVEAARAGEAGMGFAVVADEVKNLANRSAEAAKETAGLIEESIKRTELGLDITNRLSEGFKEILMNIQKVADMSKEVEAASRQQDAGINQVNKAIVQLDEVVQSNASSAEEAASSAEEMASQADILQEIVIQLVKIVTGVEEKVNTIKEVQRITYQKQPTGVALKSGTAKYKASPRKTITKEVRPEDLIPFEEDAEFTDID